MPLESIDLSSAPGHLIQRCAHCNAQNTIRLDRGAVATRPGPFTVKGAGVLKVAVDGGTAQALPLTPGTLTASALVGHLTPLSNLIVQTTGDGLVLESAAVGAGSTVVLETSPGRGAFVNAPEEWVVSGGRPVLGTAAGDFVNEDAILLRPCGCGAQESLVRTWDVAPKEVQGSRFDGHRRMVNALAQHFIDQSWVHPSAAATVRTSAPPDIVSLSPGGRLDL